MTIGTDDAHKYDADLAGLADELQELLAPDGWKVTSGRVGGPSGPAHISFEHPVSGEHGYGVGRRPKHIPTLRREIGEFVDAEREFGLVLRCPKALRHPQLLLVLRSSAFAYEWSAATVAQVAEAMRQARTLDADEVEWFVLAGPVIWGPVPAWAAYVV